jgi:ankyrin repeat protein
MFLCRIYRQDYETLFHVVILSKLHHHHIGVVSALIKRGVDVNCPLNEQDVFPLHVAAEGGYMELCKMLLLVRSHLSFLLILLLLSLRVDHHKLILFTR